MTSTLWLLVSCGGGEETNPVLPFKPVPIVDARYEPSDRIVSLTLETCDPGAVTSVREDETTIYIKAAAPSSPSERESNCTRPAVVDLREPVGERRIVNESTGDVIGPG